MEERIFADLHPALPTQENAAKRMREESLCSDHVPQKLIFKYKINGQEKNLSVVTMNLLGGLEDGAYSSLQQPSFGKLEDNKEWQIARLKIEGHCINKLTRQQDASPFICLQENNEISQEIIAETKQPYSWDDPTRHQSILYDESKYRLYPEDQTIVRIPLGQEMGASMSTFFDKNDNVNITIYNFHANFNVSIQQKESIIKRCLDQKQGRKWISFLSEEKEKLNLSEKGKGEVIHCLSEIDNLMTKGVYPTRETVWKNLSNLSKDDFKKLTESFNAYRKRNPNNEVIFFCGDSNANIAPLDSIERNICTAIGHPYYHPNKIQGGLFPDGGGSAYLDEITGEYIINQATSIAINPLTGQSYSDEELEPFNEEQLKRLNENQVEEIQKQKMVICLDQIYQSTPMILGQTIFDYEKKLRQKLLEPDVIEKEKKKDPCVMDPSIVVRPTSDMNNRHGIGIKCTNPEIVYRLQQLLQTPFFKDAKLQVEIVYDDEKNPIISICTTLSHAALLDKLLSAVPIYDFLVDPKNITSEFVEKINDINNIDTLFMHLHTKQKSTFFYSSSEKVTKLLLKQFKTLIEQDETNPFKNNPAYELIHHAAYYGEINIMKELLSTKNCNINQLAEFGRTPLALAIFKGQLEMVELLLTHHADINIKLEGQSSPLEIAVERILIFLPEVGHTNQIMYDKHLKILDSLLKNKTQLHSIPKESLQNILASFEKMFANLPKTPAAAKAIKETTKILEPICNELMIREISILPKLINIDTGFMNLHLSKQKSTFFGPSKSATKSLSTQFEALIKQDESNPFKDNSDYKLIHHAAYYGAINIMKEIVSTKNCNINQPAEFGRTPLTLAIFKGQVEMVELLLKHHADINIKLEGGASPLEIAVEKILTSLPGAGHWSPTSLIMYDKHLKILELLLKDLESPKFFRTFV